MSHTKHKTQLRSSAIEQLAVHRPAACTETAELLRWASQTDPLAKVYTDGAQPYPTLWRLEEGNNRVSLAAQRGILFFFDVRTGGH
jgi:hypothetical protein